MHIMVINIIIILICTCLNIGMFDWSWKSGGKSGKSQGILISCVSGNPVTVYSEMTLLLHIYNFI